MDGTLLNHQQEVSKDNKKSIQEAMNQGVKVVLCSGRDMSGLSEYAKGLGLDQDIHEQYLIYFGGSIIENYRHQTFYKKTLPNEYCEQIANFLEKNAINYHLIDIKGTLHSSYENWLSEWGNNDELSVVKFLLDTRERDFNETSKLIHSTYDADYFIVKTSDHEIEMFPPDVNKGTALRFLANHLQIDPQQIMAIGDMDNDLPMLKLAGLSVAMGNGTDEIKTIADVVTEDNDHSGVGIAIRQHVLETQKQLDPTTD